MTGLNAVSISVGKVTSLAMAVLSCDETLENLPAYAGLASSRSRYVGESSWYMQAPWPFKLQRVRLF